MIKEKWLSLQAREQKLIQMMAALFLIAFCYFVIWQPLNEAITDKENKIDRYQELVVWLQQQEAVYKATAQTNNKVSSNRSLSSVVNSSAVKLNISISRIQPQGNDVSITIDEVTFNVLLTWLKTLSTTHGISVKSIDLAKTDNVGVVKVRRLSLGKS